MTGDLATNFIDRYGVAIFVMLWFMLRNERQNASLVRKVNKLIITNVVIAKTLNLETEQERLIAAASDDDFQKGDTK